MTDSEERARAFDEAQEWIFAKTMADIPHFYCMKKKSLNPDEFDWFVLYLMPIVCRGSSMAKRIITTIWAGGNTGLWMRIWRIVI